MVVGDHDPLTAWISAFSRNTDDRCLLWGGFQFVTGSQILLNDTAHFTFCVGGESHKAETKPKGVVGALVTKLAEGRGIRSRPDHPRGQWSIRCAGLMGSGMFLGLCHGEVECGDTIQELVASVELETGSA